VVYAARRRVEHVSADNSENAKDYIADWIAETFREMGRYLECAYEPKNH